MVETNGGATTAFGYEIYLVPKGQPWGGDRKALVSNPEGEVRPRWEPPSRLFIDYKNARFADLYVTAVDVNGEKVQIEMRTKEPE